MIALLDLVMIHAQAWLAAGIGVFLRVGACFLVLPGLGERMIPARIRLGAALALTILLAPMLKDTVAPGGQMPPLRAYFGEAVVGLALGLALRFLVHALQTAGTIAAQAVSLSQIMGGASPDPQPAMGALLSLAGITLAVMAGLHVHLAETFLRSYDVLPFGLFPGAQDLAAWGTARVAASFSLAFALAAPFLVASLLYNLALGVINKAMPQLMVAFVGAPAITWGGLALLLVAAPGILAVWFAAFEAALVDPWAMP